MRRRWKETGEIWQPPVKPSGRPAKLKNEEHIALLRQFLDRYPQALIKDVADYLANQCGIDVDTSTVYRVMAKEGWLYKRPRARERNDLGMWKATVPRDEHGTPLYGPQKDLGKIKTRRDLDGRTKKKAALDERVFNRVDSFVRSFMSHPRFDASHDYAHVFRVVNFSKQILRAELHANNNPTQYDPMVVLISALVHDIYDHKYAGDDTSFLYAPEPNCPSRSSSPDDESTHILAESPSHPPFGHEPPSFGQSSASAPQDSSDSHSPQTSTQPHRNTSTTHEENIDTAMPPTAKSLSTHLYRLRVPRRLISPICAICSAVSYSTEISQPEHVARVLAAHPELAIVQDADRLDALGAIGTARAFTYGATKAPERGMEGTIAHMDEKLLRLEGLMKTAEGKRLAAIRAERIRAFKSWWEEEMTAGMAMTGAIIMTGVMGEVNPKRGFWDRVQRNAADPHDPNQGASGPSSSDNPQPPPSSGANGTSSSSPTETEAVDHPNRQLMMEAGMMS